MRTHSLKTARLNLWNQIKFRISLDDLNSQIEAGELKELNLIIKADVQGSVEAVRQSLVKLQMKKLKLRLSTVV